MYFDLRLLRCSTFYFGATIRPETARANRVSKVSVLDTSRYRYMELYFDTLGRLSGMYADHTRQHFIYDTTLEKKGCRRVSRIESGFNDDGITSSWKTLLNYDSFGNITSAITIGIENAESWTITYTYTDSGRYQYVIVGVDIPEKKYSFSYSYRYDTRKGDVWCLLAGSEHTAYHLGKIKRADRLQPDTCRYLEENFDCIDTINWSGFFSMRPSGEDSPLYHLRRDPQGKLLEVYCEWESWAFTYDERGLPVKMRQKTSIGNIEEEETMALYSYTYY